MSLIPTPAYLNESHFLTIVMLRFWGNQEALKVAFCKRLQAECLQLCRACIEEVRNADVEAVPLPKMEGHSA